MTEPANAGERRREKGGEAVVPESVDAASSKLVYLCLDEANGATITELTETLDMKKLALYSVLGSLSEKGLVEKRGETYHVSD
jgi:DNA-binding IclR family transcriptional regulator